LSTNQSQLKYLPVLLNASSFFPYLTTMSNNASGETLTLLSKNLSDVLGDKVHDVLLSLWLGNLELLQQLEESVVLNEPIPWLNCEHQELRGALICLMSICVLLSLHYIAMCCTSDGIDNVYRSTHRNIKLVLSEVAVTSDLNMSHEVFVQYSA
jgi:hypothetical protein